MADLPARSIALALARRPSIESRRRVVAPAAAVAVRYVATAGITAREMRGRSHGARDARSRIPAAGSHAHGQSRQRDLLSDLCPRARLVRCTDWPREAAAA